MPYVIRYPVKDWLEHKVETAHEAFKFVSFLERDGLRGDYLIFDPEGLEITFVELIRRCASR